MCNSFPCNPEFQKKKETGNCMQRFETFAGKVKNTGCRHCLLLVNTMFRVSTGCGFESPAGQLKIINSFG